MNVLKRIAWILLTVATFNCLAEPTSVPVSITSLRPYTGTNPVAVVEVSSYPLCSTNAFKINLGEPGGKEMYATALAAAMSGKQVKLEVSNTTGCQGWGTTLQSIYLIL